MGKQTVALSSPPSIISAAAVVGKKEGEGPLRNGFDYISEDSYFGEKSWEKGESLMLRQCFSLAADKAKLPPSDIEYIFAGDLLNQCTSSSLALRDSNIPYFGIYGACSTFAEGMSLGAMLIDGGFADKAAALTSSHFCSVERQYRFPLEYGGVRAPSAQWTVTGAGAVILASEGSGPRITHVTTGKIVDAGITDVNNMGAAMAPAAYESISAHLSDTGRAPEFYDAIITGDLAAVGHDIVLDFFDNDHIDLRPRYLDCGLLIFDKETQGVGSGGSGCGCCATVFSSYIMENLRSGRWKNILFAATGAIMSTISAMQGESILGVCHAVAISADKSA